MYLDNEEEEYNLSLSRFESMLKTNKVLFFDSEEFENIILHYLDSGKLNLAKKALNLGLDQHPHSTGLKLVQVELFIFQDKLELADRLLNELEEIESNNEEVYIQRANIYSKKGQHQEAIKSLQTALKYTEDFPDVYSLLGMEYLFVDEIQLAKESFILCLRYDVEDQSALYNIVYCFDFLDENKEAIIFLEDFINSNPYSEIAWHQLGRQFFTLKDFDKAVWAFDYATLIDEYFIGAYMEKGKAQEKQKKYKEAIESYLITIELDSPTSYALLRIGNCYEKLEEFTLAKKYYKDAVHEDPALDKAWIAIADLYVSLERFKKALFYLKKAIQIDDQNEKYWMRYALFNKTLLQFEDAEIGYKNAAECGEFSLEHWLDWADLLCILGNYNGAIEKLLQISEFHNDHASVECRLAAIYFILNEYSKGTYHLTIALNKDYKSVEILQNNFPLVWENPIIQNIISKYNDDSKSLD